eukprot:CAMPEP_0206024704 /NCGR_PEP_ID=MMETSP1464-20131121/38690_1 /ASSEMBLY_ACC=CAM_ASM_001124 /TAXON_ID=119497 /ORGANISM="Exanthemachrysis gayraliae, Strain RCC1523" /LENGTH=52 /DNA_ID=CAMNT_0053398723 /DNA_START=70 /DNA_END=224 /DNA_ORIENTATION=+
MHQMHTSGRRALARPTHQLARAPAIRAHRHAFNNVGSCKRAQRRRTRPERGV